MNKRRFGSVTAYLLFSAVLLQGCATGTEPGAPTATPAALTVPTPPSVSPTATPSPAEPSATPVETPRPVPPDTNITQTEYEQALARWRAHGVLEYEITLFDGPGQAQLGKMKLRIQVKSGEPQIVSYTDLNGDQPQVIPLDTVSSYDLNTLHNLSVEGRFHFLGMLFTEELAVPQGYSVYYGVKFDPALGYTTDLYSIEGENGRIIPDGGISYEVFSVHILRSNVPGMPKTGNPGP